jgi:hypothetical protein
MQSGTTGSVDIAITASITCLIKPMVRRVDAAAQDMAPLGGDSGWQ